MYIRHYLVLISSDMTVKEYRKVYFGLKMHCLSFTAVSVRDNKKLRTNQRNVTKAWCQGFLVTAVTAAPSGELVRLGSWTIPYGETSSQYLHCGGLQDTVTHTVHSSPRSHPDNIQYESLKRRLSEGLRRFHNHGEGPY